MKSLIVAAAAVAMLTAGPAQAALAALGVLVGALLFRRV